MRNEKFIYLNSHDPSRRQFAKSVETEGSQFGFEVAANIENPAGIDGPMNGNPTMLVIEGEGVDSASQYASQKARRKFPDIYVVAISDSGHAGWADKTLKRGEVNIMEKLANIEH